MGNLRGSLILPIANNDAIEKPFAELLPPRAMHVAFATQIYAQSHQSERNGAISWGRYFAYTKNDPVESAVASVHSAILAFSPTQHGRTMSVRQVAEECLEHLPQWCARLTDWIEVLTRDDLNPAHSLSAQIAPKRWTTAAWIHTSSARPEYTFVNPVLSLFGSDGKNAMGASEWSAAIRAANARRDLPEIWTLLRDARGAQRRGNGRRAVLDAATAAELIIDRQLRARLLRDNDVAFVDNLLKSTWQVSRRMDLMKSLGMWLPAGLETKLSSLRNRVGHSNAAVTRGQAIGAVDVAEDLARHYEASLLK